MAFGIVSELWETAVGFIGGMWDSIMTIWEGFQEGDIMKVVGGLFEFALNLLGLALTAVIAFGGFLLGLAWGFIKGIYDDVVGKAGSWQGAIMRMALKVLKVVGGIFFLAALRNALMNPGMWGPVLVAGLVLALAALAEKFFDKFDWFSKGGVSTGGLAVVGEKGPELVNLPKGSRVHSNAESRRMGGNNIHVHVNGRVGASDAEIRDIANKVAREVNLRMNRTGATAGRF